MRQSWFGRASMARVAPVAAWLGLGNGRPAARSLTGMLAKEEIVVSTLAQVYVGEGAVEADEAASPDVLAGLADIVTGFGAATLEAGGACPTCLPRRATIRRVGPGGRNRHCAHGRLASLLHTA